MEHFRPGRIILVLLTWMVTRVQLQLLLLNVSSSGRVGTGVVTESTFCVLPPLPNRPDCKVTFREDAGWTNTFNATCIKPNVFLLPFERASKQALLSGPRQVLSTNQDILPPYLRFTCRATFPIDFDFQGNGGIEFFRVWKSVSYVNGTDTFSSQVINVELLMSPEATGRFTFHSIENPVMDASFFVLAEGPADGTVFVRGGQGRSLIGRITDAGKWIIPCILSKINATIDLYQLQKNSSTWTRIGNSNDPLLRFTSENGFSLNPSSSTNVTEIQFQCRVGDQAMGDIVNVTLPLGSSNPVPDKQLLKIQLEEGARCTGPESEGQLKLFNIFVRNPTESHIIANCIVRGMRNCGGDGVYHRRIEGVQRDRGLCGTNQTSGFCTVIPPSQLHKEGLLICIGATQSTTLEYFTGLDGKTYTDPRLAPPSALLRVKWSAYGQTTPESSGLVTGIRYELKCLSVEFPFVKESQLLYVKFRNGTQELFADLVWWKAGKEVYLSPEMVELECRDRLWTTNELYNSSTAIVVANKTCNLEQFRCTSSQCIRDTWRCDGDKDCMDASDEEDCHIHRCKPGFFKCLGGQCVPLDKRCNNKRDCPDASDESFETCSNTTCTADEFKCQNGQCVLAHFLCDGDGDCFDHSDESRENCAKYFPTISTVNQNSTFIDGSPGELICDTSSLPSKLKARIEWWRQNLNVTDVTRLWRNADNSKLALRFPAVREVDAGDYTCFAENSLSRSSLTFHVTVLNAEPTSTIRHDSEPDDFSPCDYDLDEGDCLQLLCQAHPRLPLCRLKDTRGDSHLESVVNHLDGKIGTPAWVTVVGVALLFVVVLVLGLITWKYYSSSNLRLPFGAVRFGQGDQVDMLDR